MKDQAVHKKITNHFMEKATFFSLFLIIFSFSAAAKDKVNLIVGTQTFGVKYKFTDDTSLMETAKQIYDMGSDIIKFSLSKNTMGGQYFDIPYNSNINSLIELARDEPSVKSVLDLPFNNFITWIYPFAPGANSFVDGYSAEEAANAYNEIYNFCVYLLNTYNNSGKTFYLGHWEGDWYLHPNYDPDAVPSDTAITGMIKWLNVRQQAVNDAKKDTVFTNVQLYNYAEVNLVQKGMDGKKCMVNNVLPDVDVDFVSYSSYDTTSSHKGNVSNILFSALNYIESKMKHKDGFSGKRVFIGEYGFPFKATNSQELQDSYSKDVCRAAIQWGTPFVLYWQMYCNETNALGEHIGFWLIDDNNRKQILYYTFKNYYTAINSFGKEYIATAEAAITEIDVIGDEVPEPGTLFLFGLILSCRFNKKAS